MPQESSSSNRKLLLAACGCGGALALLILLIFLIGVGVWWSSKQSEARAIERVLAADRGTSQNASSVAEIVQRMRAIDMSGCPVDFRQAYLAHIDAWVEMAAVEDAAAQWKVNYDSRQAMVEAFMRGLVFDLGILRESDDARNRVLEMNRRASLDI